MIRKNNPPPQNKQYPTEEDILRNYFPECNKVKCIMK